MPPNITDTKDAELQKKITLRLEEMKKQEAELAELVAQLSSSSVQSVDDTYETEKTGKTCGTAIQPTETQEEQPQSSLHRSPFFHVLNKIVRSCIYDYLYECLPPFSGERDSAADSTGMILSCKQAYAELSEAAASQFSIEFRIWNRNHRASDLDFSKVAPDDSSDEPHAWSQTDNDNAFGEEPNICVVPSLRPGFASLRNITLTVPFDRVAPSRPVAWGDLPQCWPWLRPILLCRLDSVTIRVTDMKYIQDYDELKLLVLHKMIDKIQEERHAHLVAKVVLEHNRQARVHSRQEEQYTFEPLNMLCLMHSSTGIQTSATEGYSTWEEFEGRYEPRLLIEVNKPQVQTKKIRLAWGPSQEDPNPLLMLHDFSRKLLKGDGFSAAYLEVHTIASDNCFALGNDQWPHEFLMRSYKREQGEMGIFHPNRWEYGWSDIVKSIQEAREARLEGVLNPPYHTPLRDIFDRVMHL